MPFPEFGELIRYIFETSEISAIIFFPSIAMTTWALLWPILWPLWNRA
jgi:hypothetical protein